MNAQDQMNGETPLHLANAAGHRDIVQLLLKNGADASLENVWKKKALHNANVNTQVRMTTCKCNRVVCQHLKSNTLCLT